MAVESLSILGGLQNSAARGLQQPGLLSKLPHFEREVGIEDLQKSPPTCVDQWVYSVQSVLLPVP